jgi:prepilin-type N-terminal cleavage/methylation domain-containing protein
MPRLNVPPSPRRPGLTLVELLIVIMILGLVGSATFRVLNKQQQAYKDGAKQAAMQRELRTTGSSLPQEMRSTSSAGLDIQDVSESAISFSANIGSGIICDFAGGSHILLPPLNGAQITLTNWYTQPVAGDSIFIYDDGPLSGSEDDSWIRRRVASVDTRPDTDCPGAPFTDPVNDVGKLRWRIGVGAGLPATVQPGTVVRFARPVRYSLYQSSASLEWYLGYEEQAPSGWTTIEAVGGPFRPYAAGDDQPSGVQLRYFDSLGVRITGNSLTDRRGISRVDVYLRTNAGLAAVTERRPNEVVDSLMMRVAIRNFK